MTQTSALKSASITNLDSTPVVPNSCGMGAPDRLRTVDDYVTTLSGDQTGSTYKVVRIPSTAIVKSVVLESEAMTGGKFDIGLYYSDSAVDGTPSGVQGTLISANFFATDVDCSSAVGPTNEVNQSGNYTLNLRAEPIWQAAGLSADPGGFLDVVLTCHTTAVTTGARIGLKVEYAE